MSLQELYREIWKERKHNCTGCGRHLGNEPLLYMFSHTIKKSTRPDLKLEKDNILLECVKCHQWWESRIPHKMKQLKNIKTKMLYIKANDVNLYYKLTNNDKQKLF